MKQIKCYGDSRFKGFCVHCGGPDETDDHVPSKVFLDEPYPANLMVCSSCLSCNNSFSIDEAYVACFLECVLAGEADPVKVRRGKIGKALLNDAALLERLRRARKDTMPTPTWSVEQNRVQTVVTKLARCHAAYEYNLPQLEEPSLIGLAPLLTMSAAERSAFEGADGSTVAGWPEVGSRAMQRLLVVDSNVFQEDWIVVQEDNYRFRVSQEDGLTVKIVLREYLACEVRWS
jgi:hypothetical protein